MKNKPKKFVVYKITNIINDMSYIGITGNYKKRMREHFCSKDNYYLHRTIQKYGKEKFITEIIFECNSWDEAKKEEIDYIKVFNTRNPNGYNLTNGGEGVLGYKPSKEACKKISESKKGKKCPEETRKKISESSKGKKLTEEHKRKISEANKGQRRSDKTCKRMSKANKNPSKELRKKISESVKIFSKDQILEIRKMLSDGIIYKVIAKKFNVHQTTVGGIKRNEYYADIQLSGDTI